MASCLTGRWWRWCRCRCTTSPTVRATTSCRGCSADLRRTSVIPRNDFGRSRGRTPLRRITARPSVPRCCRTGRKSPPGRCSAPFCGLSRVRVGKADLQDGRRSIGCPHGQPYRAGPVRRFPIGAELPLFEMTLCDAREVVGPHTPRYPSTTRRDRCSGWSLLRIRRRAPFENAIACDSTIRAPMFVGASVRGMRSRSSPHIATAVHVVAVRAPAARAAIATALNVRLGPCPRGWLLNVYV